MPVPLVVRLVIVAVSVVTMRIMRVVVVAVIVMGIGRVGRERAADFESRVPKHQRCHKQPGRGKDHRPVPVRLVLAGNELLGRVMGVCVVFFRSSSRVVIVPGGA